MDEDESEAPGWDAIDAALASLYGEQKPLHNAPVVPAFLGGNDPLNGISVYRSTFGGVPHWHFVTYGYSDLYEKETDDADVSGFGFEMTVRVVDPLAQDEPPGWVISLLQNMARYVFRTGNVFAVGHHSTTNGPIALDRKTELCAVAFARDPDLAPLETVHGSVEFLQLVGLTQDEYDAVLRWDTERFLAVMGARNPALLTDLERTSLLADAAARREVEAGTARDGSSTHLVFSPKGSLGTEHGQRVLGVAATTIHNLHIAMRGRLAHGRTVVFAWPEGSAVLAPETVDITTLEGEVLVLSTDDQAAILGIPERRGDYSLPGGVVLRVLPVDIYDGTRTKVVKVVG